MHTFSTRPRGTVPATLLTLLILLGCCATAYAESTPALPHGVWPLQPRPEVVHGFDPPESTWGAGHRGVDLLGHVGQQVHASAAGRVSFAGTLAGRGVVVVDHGAVRTTYEPVSPTVPVGTVVDAGQAIGTLQLGMSHCFPRACLHWGLIQRETGADRYLDPLLLVGLGPIRLLPVDGSLPSSVRSTPGWSGAVETSGPGVRLLVGLAQAIGGDVGVDLGRGQ